ncbi:hypothetical protein MKEN_00596700 [Mycena kentingensis (nom. inval.)]|nr:hypothetical protein MKEN_00596700 [Mycena kentingensis (nom. inval.)]
MLVSENRAKSERPINTRLCSCLDDVSSSFARLSVSPPAANARPSPHPHQPSPALPSPRQLRKTGHVESGYATNKGVPSVSPFTSNIALAFRLAEVASVPSKRQAPLIAERRIAEAICNPRHAPQRSLPHIFLPHMPAHTHRSSTLPSHKQRRCLPISALLSAAFACPTVPRFLRPNHKIRSWTAALTGIGFDVRSRRAELVAHKLMQPWTMSDTTNLSAAPARRLGLVIADVVAATVDRAARRNAAVLARYEYRMVCYHLG